MVFSTYKKQRILYYHFQRVKPHTITLLLLKEKIRVSKWGVAKFLKRYQQSGVIGRCVSSGRPSKVTAEIKVIVEEQMRRDDKTTAFQLHHLLIDKGYQLSHWTILRCRKSLGWTFRGSAYCQLIQENNKVKRLAWAQKHINDDFADVVWTDECTVQMETHRQFCCRKRGEPPRNKPKLVFVSLVQSGGV